MESHDGDINWQKEAPNLSSIGKDIPYTVPENYFKESALNIVSRTNIEQYRLPDQREFKLPENYFKELSDEINSRIAISNINGLVPGDGFIYPNEYFSEVNTKINKSVSQNLAEKRAVRKLVQGWLSIAAAACTTIILGSVLYLNSGYNLNRELSEVPDEEIINYLQVHSTMSDTPFIIEHSNPDELQQVNEDISDEELEKYINNTKL